MTDNQITISRLIIFLAAKKWKSRIIIALLILLTLVITSIIEPLYDKPARERRLLFGGKFEIVIRASGWIPFMMPGQSGDASGEITIYALPSKISCGTTSVNMVSNFTLDYNESSRIVTLERPASALWDLNNCSIRHHNLYPGL